MDIGDNNLRNLENKQGETPIMAMNFQETFGNFVFIGLMVIAIFGSIITIQSDNNATQPLIEHSLFNSSYVNLNNSLFNLESNSNTQYSLFDSEKPTPGFGAIVLFTIVNVGKTFGGIIFILFAAVIKLPLIILGISPTITSVLVSFLTISVILALWAVYKFGG